MRRRVSNGLNAGRAARDSRFNGNKAAQSARIHYVTERLASIPASDLAAELGISVTRVRQLAKKASRA